MKFYLPTLLFLLIAFQQFVVGQENGEKHFYVSPSKEIKTSYFNEIKDSIALVEYQEDNNTFLGVSSAVVGIVIGELVPVLVEKVGLLAYNPKNYISEYGTSYLFDKNALKNTSNIDKIVFTRTGVRSNAKETISMFEFDLKNISKGEAENLEGYTAIGLISFQSNYTKVKLKSSGKKANIVIEMTAVYYDPQDKKQELHLQPYKLSAIVPLGVNNGPNLIDSKKRNYQIIPPMKFIETLSIKITEVNDRKKDWDKYLELFNNQKGNISGFLIDQLK